MLAVAGLRLEFSLVVTGVVVGVFNFDLAAGVELLPEQPVPVIEKFGCFALGVLAPNFKGRPAA